jgi:hypothetical protein
MKFSLIEEIDELTEIKLADLPRSPTWREFVKDWSIGIVVARKTMQPNMKIQDANIRTFNQKLLLILKFAIVSLL